MLKRILLASGVLLFLGASAAFAQNSATFNVNITIRTPIVVTKVTDLDFGTVESVAAATYTVNPVAGTGSPTHSAGVTARAASFTVTGEAGQTALVFLTPNPVTAVNGANTVSINLTPEAGPYTFPFPATFYVGGDVTLTGAEPSGLYTTTATLQVLYQ